MRTSSSEQEVRLAFDVLNKALQDAIAPLEHCSGQSQTVRVHDFDATGDYVNGQLLFRQQGLAVGVRDYQDDYADGVGETDPALVGVFDVHELVDTSVDWLSKLAAPDVIESLMVSIAQHLEARQARHQQATVSVTAKTREAYACVAKALEHQASELGAHQVLEAWRRAQVLDVEPETALTQALTILESVLQYLNQHWGLGVPPDANNARLYTAVKKRAVAALDPSLSHVEGVLNGIGNIITGVGGLRNKASTAHAQAPGQTKPTPSLARLAVNSAGVVAAFLMGLVEHPPSAGAASPSE